MWKPRPFFVLLINEPSTIAKVFQARRVEIQEMHGIWMYCQSLRELGSGSWAGCPAPGWWQTGKDVCSLNKIHPANWCKHIQYSYVNMPPAMRLGCFKEKVGCLDTETGSDQLADALVARGQTFEP